MPIIAGYQPAQNTLQQYVPLPFQEMMMAGQAVQNRADEFNATTDAFSDGLLKAKVLEGDKGILQQKSKEFQAIVDEANKGNIADPVAYQKIKSKIKSIANDSEFIQAQEHYLYNQKAMENYSDIVKAGDYGDELTWDYMQSLQNYNKSGGLRGGNNLGDNMFTKGTKINEGMEKHFDEIPQTGSESLHALGEYYYKTGWKGISEGRITNAAMTSFETFYNSPEGNQMKMQYKMQTDQGLIDPNATSRKQWIFDQFLATGLRRVGGISDLGDLTTVHNKMIDDEHARIKEQEEDGRPMESPLENANNSIVDNMLNKYNSTLTEKTGHGTVGPFGAPGSTGSTTRVLSKVEAEKAFVNSLDSSEKQTYNGLKATLKTHDAVIKYMNDIKNRKISSSYTGYGNKKSNDDSTFMTNHIGSYHFYNMTTGKMELPDKVKSKITKDSPLTVLGQYSNDNWITDWIPDQDAAGYFAKPTLVTIGGEQYAVSQTLGELYGDQHVADVNINKISQSRRTGMPIEMTNSQVSSTPLGISFMNDKYHLTYTKNGKKNVVSADTPDEIYSQIKQLEQ